MMRFKLFPTDPHMVCDGIPPILASNSAATPISATLLSYNPLQPWRYLEIVYDSTPQANQLVQLPQQSAAVRNRWGGTLSPAEMLWPNCNADVTNFSVNASYVDGSHIDLIGIPPFGSLAGAYGAQMINTTTGEVSVSWVPFNGTTLRFYFVSFCQVGDYVVIPGSQPYLTSSVGGTNAEWQGNI